MMNQNYPILSQIYEYSDSTGFDWSNNKLSDDPNEKSLILDIIPAPLQNVAPDKITAELDTSFLDKGDLKRNLMKVQGIKTLGRRPQVAATMVAELKKYFSQKSSNPFEGVLANERGVSAFTYGNNALTLEMMKGRNLNLNILSLNRGFDPKILSTRIKESLKIADKLLTKVQIRNFELLSAYLDSYKKTRKPAPKKEKVSFDLDDRDIFFGGASEIEPEDVRKAYDYWEDISKKIERFSRDVKELAESLDPKDKDMKALIDFLEKNEEGGKYPFLDYMATFPEKNVELKEINSRVDDFIKNYLIVFNIISIVSDDSIKDYSPSDVRGEMAQFYAYGESLNQDSADGAKTTDIDISAGIRGMGDSAQAAAESDVEEARLNQAATKLPFDRSAKDIDFNPKELTPLVPVDKLVLDAISILALDRNSETFTTDIENGFFADLAIEKIRDLMERFEKNGIPFTKEDTMNFLGFLGHMKTFEEEQSGKFPVFFATEAPLNRYYKNLADDAKEKEEKIGRFFLLLQKAIETENTILPQNINLRMYGAVEGGGESKIPPSEKPIYEYRRQVAGKGTGNLKRSIDTDLIKDIISDIELLYYGPQDSKYCFGLDLPFSDNGAINVLMTYGDSKEFAGINQLYSNMREFKTKMFRVSTLKKLARSMKKINDGFPTIKQAKKGFEDFVSALAKTYRINKDDEYYNVIVNDAAAMLGSLKARMGNKEKVSLMGVDVDRAYEQLIDAISQESINFSNLRSIRDFMRFFKKRSAEAYFGEVYGESKTGDRKKSEAIAAIDTIKTQMKNLKMTKSISDKILEVHDSLRLLKKETIYYGQHNLEDYDSMQNMIVKMQNQFSRDMSVNELTSIVSEVNAFDDISKSYGISKEEVYFIKANFR